MEELRQEAARAKADEEEAARVKAADQAKEVVLAAHNGDTERLRALLEANPNLVDAVGRAKFALLLGRNETSL